MASGRNSISSLVKALILSGFPGQNRSWPAFNATSALPSGKDIFRVGRQVRSVPTMEVASYSITSSARAKSIGGTSRSRAFAVAALMTNSNFID